MRILIARFILSQIQHQFLSKSALNIKLKKYLLQINIYDLRKFMQILTSSHMFRNLFNASHVFNRQRSKEEQFHMMAD